MALLAAPATHIVISPEQADIVSSTMGDIAYWFEDIKDAAGD